jgi:hypothetical protein
MDEQQSIFFIDLEYDEARVFYSGQKNRVQVTTVDGVTINLPWAMLQPYFTTSGVQGRFRIRYTVAGKLLQLESYKSHSTINPAISSER